MQIQVHTNDNIQGGESLMRWAQVEADAKLARFREHVTRVELFLSGVGSGGGGGPRPAAAQRGAATAEAAKVADAVAAALDKLVRSLGDDITRAKDRQGRETIRTAE